MKKRTSYLYIFVVFLAIILSSCKLKIEEEDLLDAPGVNVTNKQVTLIIPKTSSDTSYVNVYRRDKQNDTVVNIGILFHPEALENDKKNYCFIDSLVKVNHSYQYKVRYKTNGDYYDSAWSDSIKIESGYTAYPDNTNLAYQVNGIKLIFERIDYSLTFYGTGTITEPSITNFSTDYVPMLIVQSDSATQVLELTSIAKDTKIYLRSYLPKKFLDKKISIKGIVAQKTEWVDDTKPIQDRDIKRIIWTEPTSLEVVGAGSDKKILVPSQSGSDGFDYSRKAK